MSPRENLLDASCRLTMQAHRANEHGDREEGMRCGWMAMYLDARARGHSKHNASMRANVYERRGDL